MNYWNCNGCVSYFTCFMRFRQEQMAAKLNEFLLQK